MSQKPASYLIVFAGLNGLVATALSAVGAHALPADITEAGRSFFATATRFHMMHSLAMLGAAIFLQVSRQNFAKWAAISFQLGICAFSFSLYWRVFMGEGSLGSFHWVTPFGGLMLMVGWIYLTLAGFKATVQKTG